MKRWTRIKIAYFGTVLCSRFRYLINGETSAEKFFKDFLKEDMEHPAWWDDDEPLVLDFEGVETLSPTWCHELVWNMVEGNETVTERSFRERVKFVNMSKVKRETMDTEIRCVFEPENQARWRETVREDDDE